MQRGLTALWQYQNPNERQWVDEIFGPYIREHVFDGRREVVLDDCILFDAFTFAESPAYYRQFRGRNAFLCEFLDEFYQGRRYDTYRNFRGVFRNFWSGFFDPRSVRPLPLGYQNDIRADSSEIRPASSREFVWSMLGDIGKASRPDAVRALIGIAPHYLRATPPQPQVGRELYREMLLKSAFVPCPMGNANLESYRTYEALECGAIPIVERRWTLDYYHRLLGPGFPGIAVSRWPSARARILDLLNDPARLDDLQRQCVAWWRDYKITLSGGFGEFLSERSASGAETTPLRFVSRVGPVLQSIELARHHSFLALMRRLRRQITRLRVEGRWREAKR